MAFAPKIAVEGSKLGIPERLSGTSSSTNSSSRSMRNIRAKAESLRYNGSVKRGMSFAKFRTLSRNHGWNDDECLITLSVSVDGPVLLYFHSLLSVGKRRTFGEIASRFTQRFGKGILQTASQVELSSVTQEARESIEQ